MKQHRDYLPRLTDRLLASLLEEFPALMVIGPRAAGKTTTARRLCRTALSADRPEQASALRAGPDAVLATMGKPLLIDEWQLVPDVLSAVKRAVDDDDSPGQFILTGSARSDALAEGWPATGRVIRVRHWGLSRRELTGDIAAPSFFDLLFAGDAASIRPSDSAPSLRDYIRFSLSSGFPAIARTQSDATRKRWLESYVDQLITRDAALLGEVRDAALLRRYFRALAANTAGIPEHKTVYDAAGISRMTALAYDAVLELVMATEQVPAWTSGHLGRIAHAPKRYLVEPALLVPLLGVDERALLRDGDLLGRLLDTFVVAQLRPELEVAEQSVRLYHLRHDGGRHEIDLLAEAPDGRVVAFEIKASATIDVHDARHLAWLRDQLGDAFVAGVVFHTGPLAYSLGERIVALPIGCIWDRGPAT
ncbi:MAG: ATP-binding protein [Myxococcales bacterium]|nr:ATP-binding protein [Myxococcales bacterium]